MFKTRRRVLRIMAVGAGVVATPGSLFAGNNAAELIEWNSRALGADISIQLYSTDKQKTENTLKNTALLIHKYEKMFSLYDINSETSKLNKTGFVKNVPAEFIELLELSIGFNRETNGAFDITIQPLWNLYSDHFSNGENGNLEAEIANVLNLIGSQNINIDQNNVSFAKKNMAISFNGIAQGYITDKVTAYLSRHGFKNTLVDMGEYSAGGPQINGEPWRIGLLDPFDTISIAGIIEMDSGAVATSGGYGDQFTTSGKYHHLFDPHTGLSSDHYASVTVSAKDATTADALSTAFSNMSISDIKTTISKHPSAQARLTLKDGDIVTI